MIATTMVSGAAQVGTNQCQWCGEKPWQFSCASCDPRTLQHVCIDCADRWHSRGASKTHPLKNRQGIQQPYSAWLLAHNTTQNGNETLGESLVSSQSSPVATSSEHAVGGESSLAAATQAQPPNAASPAPATETNAEASTNANSGKIVGETEDVEFGVPDEPEHPVTEEVPIDIPAQLTEEMQLDLEDVLDRLPSQEGAILDALADHTHAAICVEDAVMCEKHTQCQEQYCQQTMAHYRHVKDRKVCSATSCEAIAMYLTHMEFCQRDECAFCVRIKQRRLFGKKHGINYLIQNQRRAIAELNRATDQAAIRFAHEQIAALERKLRAASEAVEKLNRLVVTERLPTFNFPRFSWHVAKEPIIKREPGLGREEEEDGEISEPATQVAVTESRDNGTVDGGPHIGGGVGRDEEEDAANVVDEIVDLVTKKNSGDVAARAKLEESVQLAFRIVDASFCSHTKASRCLLNCQNILVHLQHHVDLKVCKSALCDTVEQHFSHVSACQSAGNERDCEYCLRVSEREFARAVEVMEAERVETELKLQRLITSITDSLSNDPHDEREDNVMQLDDELQQAEDYKKALIAKIDGASLNLVKARRRMKRHPANPPSSFIMGLPLHFIKQGVSASPQKKRSRK